MEKIAIVLCNLGGPCCNQAIEPFLFNLFYDPAIINLPNPFRRFLAGFISSRRRKEATHIYNQIGGGSPILANTYAQAQALQTSLNNQSDDQSWRVFVYMRYSYPFIEDVMSQLEIYNPDRVVLLPLYPQYSTTTSKSSIEQFSQYYKLPAPLHIIESYPEEEGFISAYQELIRNSFTKLKDDKQPIILFSAHGIPLNRIKKGDPYQKHVVITATKIMENIGIPFKEWHVCYQSKVGPLKWLEPSTVDLITKHSQLGRSIMVVPLSFVSEHSETLVELDIEYGNLAKTLGAHDYVRVPTVSQNNHFISGLTHLIAKAL